MKYLLDFALGLGMFWIGGYVKGWEGGLGSGAFFCSAFEEASDLRLGFGEGF